MYNNIYEVNGGYMKKKLALVLSGGGALGMAHLGVLKALEENNIKPDIVVGTSIGALVGGVYCAGIPLDRIVEEAQKVKTFHLYDLNLDVSGLLSGRNALRTIKNILGNKDYMIEDLPIKYGAVAVDVEKGEEVLFTQGSLLNAIRASISAPGVFVPLKIGNKRYVDGGVLNNLPEDQARNMGADKVLSVYLLSDFTPFTTPKTAVHSIAFSWFIMQTYLIKLKKNYSDYRLNLPLKDYRQYIFNKKVSTELMSIGYMETIKHMPEIKKALEIE